MKLRNSLVRDEKVYEIWMPSEEGAVYVATAYFIEGNFSRCAFSFKGDYTREQWKVLSLIEKELTKIEKGLSNGT